MSINDIYINSVYLNVSQVETESVVFLSQLPCVYVNLNHHDTTVRVPADGGHSIESAYWLQVVCRILYEKCIMSDKVS